MKTELFNKVMNSNPKSIENVSELENVKYAYIWRYNDPKNKKDFMEAIFKITKDPNSDGYLAEIVHGFSECENFFVSHTIVGSFSDKYYKFDKNEFPEYFI